MHTFLRRHVTAVKDRFYEAAPIGKKVANPHELLARSSDDVTLERFRGEKALGHPLCPSRDQRQDWSVLQSEADHAIWHRGGEHLLHGLPKRTDVHRAVQVTASVGPEPWFVTKISNSTELAEFRGTTPGREMR